MSLRINDTAPDFTAETTDGEISFHDWIGDGYAVLFSHPKDFTPVCTTELGVMAGMMDEFAKRNCKILGISVDPVENHLKWKSDIEQVSGQRRGDYPMIGDPELKVAKLYDMLPASAGETSEGAYTRRQRNRALRVRDWSGQEGETDPHLSDDDRAQLR